MREEAFALETDQDVDVVAKLLQLRLPKMRIWTLEASRFGVKNWALQNPEIT